MLTLDTNFENQTYKGQDLSLNGYDNCIFINCNFEKTDFAEVNFTDCQFTMCHFGNATLDNVGFKGVAFDGCNFLGTDFSSCSPFLLKMSFKDCQMDLSNLSGMKLKGAEFLNCRMKEADFTESDLTETTFDGCDLDRAIFQGNNLTKADFREAKHYSFEPAQNILKKTRFSKDGVIGLLSRYDIIVD